MPDHSKKGLFRHAKETYHGSFGADLLEQYKMYVQSAESVSAGRIYALDLGADHHNPDCNRIGEKHKHRWTETFRDKQAYVPKDITEPWDRPIEVWNQFCTEARIHHTGRMEPPAV